MQKLSKTGFHRIPANPHQRNFAAGGVKKAGEVLEAFNEKQEDRVLTPRQGWRNLSVRRSRAQYLVASIKRGASADLSQMRRFLQHGY